jgi:hypothetical protein
MSRCNRVTAHAAIAAIALGLGTRAMGQAGVESAEDSPSSAQTCLNHSSIRRTKILNAENILFVTRSGQTYNSPLPRECPSLNRNSLVNYGVVGDRICAGSSFQVLWRMGMDLMPTFVCQLGLFVPITEDEVADLMALTDESPKARKQRRRSSREMVTTTPIELPRAEAPADVGATPSAAE